MKFENTYIGNFKGAFKGLRNPKNSWDKSDSLFGLVDFVDYTEVDNVVQKWIEKDYPELDINSNEFFDLLEEYTQKIIKDGVLNINYDLDVAEVAFIGPNDMKLAQTLIKAGPEHRKFLRQIFVSVDITAPLYWWKEMDQYKIGTVTDSASTMHKLASKPITLDCFETDDFNDNLQYYMTNDTGMLAEFLIEQLEFLRLKYLETKDIKYWKELVRWLPCGWLQTRTWTANYEVLRSILNQRGGHKLVEWEAFIKWIYSLPYAAALISCDIPIIEK